MYIFFLFRTTLGAYGNCWARDQIWAATASLHHSHSNTRSKLHLWPMLQLGATPDPQPTEWGQGSNLHPHGDYFRFLTCWAITGTLGNSRYIVTGLYTNSKSREPIWYFFFGICRTQTRAWHLPVILINLLNRWQNEWMPTQTQRQANLRPSKSYPFLKVCLKFYFLHMSVPSLDRNLIWFQLLQIPLAFYQTLSAGLI